MSSQLLLVFLRFSGISNAMSNTDNYLQCDNLFYKCTLIVTNSYYIIYILFYISLLMSYIVKKYKWLVLMSNMSNAFRKSLLCKVLERYSLVTDE